MLETNLPPDLQLISDANRIVEYDFAERKAKKLSLKERWAIEDAEWAEAMAGIPDEETCHAFSAELNRRCAMRDGHRTAYHRNCEVSWEDGA